MAMTDSPKRKAPEADVAPTPAAEADKAAAAEAGNSASAAVSGNVPEADVAPTPAAEAEKAAEPDAKRLKTSPSVDLKAVRKQVEYYLSDDNLKRDKFFHDKITEEGNGWLDTALILSCKKMTFLRATRQDIVEALKESQLEVKDEGKAIRRPGNAALPPLEAKTMTPQQKKSSLHAHDGGAVIVFKGVPAEQSWQQIKEKLKAVVPTHANLWFVSEVDDKGQCFVAVSPFENDVEFFAKLNLEVGGTTLKCELCQGDVLQGALKMLPKYLREKREKAARQRQKERNRPIVLGTQKFVNVSALRTRIKEIINARSDGEQLKADGSDFKLVKALLEYHPKGAEKSEGLVGLKVAQSTHGGNKCFFMIKADGKEDDFSAIKCLAAIEANPPYEKKPEAAAKPDATPAAASAAPAAPAAEPEKAAAAPAAEAEKAAA